MLLLQLALIFALPYISTVMSVSGLVSMEKLLHTRLGCEWIAYPRRERCRYSKDLCAQGHYCGGSQGVNLPSHGTSSPKHAASVCMVPPGPAGLHKPGAHMHSQHFKQGFSNKKSVGIFAGVHQPIPVLLTNLHICIYASCLRGKKVVLFLKRKETDIWRLMKAQGLQMVGSKVASLRT